VRVSYHAWRDCSTAGESHSALCSRRKARASVERLSVLTEKAMG
jgi:hypothetical protein